MCMCWLNRYCPGGFGDWRQSCKAGSTTHNGQLSQQFVCVVLRRFSFVIVCMCWLNRYCPGGFGDRRQSCRAGSTAHSGQLSQQFVCVVLRRFCHYCVYVLAQPLLRCRWVRRQKAKLQSKFHHPHQSAVPAICLWF